MLADNMVNARNARGEHGLAFWIETGENCLLLDTGQVGGAGTAYEF
jgi:metal-dependent hydrolase (beta-lactamase superfamily II)